MGINTDEIPDYLERAEIARLIPVVSDTSKEQRVTSVVLAAMMSVEDFGRALLSLVDAPASKSAKIKCYTEVVFKGESGVPKLRPDGLIVVKLGSKEWSALVEAKVGNSELDASQIQEYLTIAQAQRIDALITISNQYATRPTDHPVAVNGLHLKGRGLYHWSWMSMLAEAVLVAEHRGVSDPEQAYILREVIRYLQHDSSGVQAFTQMGPAWKDVCVSVQQGSCPPKDSPEIVSGVTDWFQLTRYLAIQLGLSVGRSVSVALSKEHSANFFKRTSDATKQLVKEFTAETEFVIPDAASKLRLIADLKGRHLLASMRLRAPIDKAQARSTITWILRQTEKCSDDEILIRAKWPGRTPDTVTTLGRLRTNKDAILQPNVSDIPVAFEVERMVDLGAKFRGTKSFVESAELLIVGFYRDVGQHLKAWVPSAPKVKPEAPTGVSAVTASDAIGPSVPPTEMPSSVAAAEVAVSPSPSPNDEARTNP